MSSVPHTYTYTHTTLPLSLPARLVTRTASWRNGLRQGDVRRTERFDNDASHAGIRSASLLAYLAPLTKPGISESVACAGYGPCIVQLAGRWQGRVSFEASDDGIAWHTIPLVALHSGATATEATACGMWRTPQGCTARFLRLHVGTITGTIVGVIAAAALPATLSMQLPHAA